MRFRSRTWFLLSLMFLLAAIFFWRLDQFLNLEQTSQPTTAEGKHYPRRPAPATTTNVPPHASLSSPALLTQVTASGTAARLITLPGFANAASAQKPAQPGNRFPLRLSNTRAPLAELTRSDRAILLRNALIDTGSKEPLAVPGHLRAAATRNYLVQSRGPAAKEFRHELQAIGAEIVSYIPNNSFLVRVPEANRTELEHLPRAQAVLPYQPYYKLDDRLLPLAVAKETMPEEGWLRVTIFPGEKENARQSLVQAGAQIQGEERTPFGPQFIIRPDRESLVQLAQLDFVQGLEAYLPRHLLDDLQRVTLGVATNGSTKDSYLGLTGSNVVVNVNDGGADASNPNLVGRVFVADSKLLSDPDGHGTHVLGILLGSGARSSSVKNTPPGSDTNANFRGIAPGAKAFVFPFKFSPDLNSFVSDSFLEDAAVKTNALYFHRTNATLVSNNSWGYVGKNDYDSSAARFDAGVRDGSPDGSGPQPILSVFAAGNSGAGSDNGLNGDPNSVISPATAKNVITVGAIENFRNITNFFLTDTNGVLVTNPNTNGIYITNSPYLGLTDSSSQVAAFSSRGNVGIGTEGPFGRFKPDVVAPGTFVIAARSGQFTDLSDTNSPTGDTNAPIFSILADLNAALKPTYRFETGTSMAAPAVSGMLALMQEFFEQKLPEGSRHTNSPALMKALLINGARSASEIYNFQVQNSINYQGWGLVNLTNSIPEALLRAGAAASPVQFFDQDPTNALTTGDSKAWNVQLSSAAQQFPLRVTLVWTDPPGNPNAGIKLVNDLDLVVSNTVTRAVFYGNDIPDGSNFNHPSTAETPPASDNVNNVENVFIREPDATNIVVRVIGRRINVDAIHSFHEKTGNTNDVAQDFALVISSANTSLTNALTITPFTGDTGVVFFTNAVPGSVSPTNAPPGTNATPAVNTVNALTRPPLMAMTNGMPLLNQRVGAQPPLVAAPGVLPQWRFYVFTNIFFTNSTVSLTNGQNVAFITFSPPNLSRPRHIEADIDLYVSTDPGLTNLDATAVAEARKSLGPGGSESVVFTDAAIGQVFYLAVKAEDQQAAEFGLIAISSNRPFDENQNGARIIHGYPIRAAIPDGTANAPGAVQIFGIGVRPITIERVVVTNTIVHENVGDLIGNLSHNGHFVILNNHTLNNGRFAGTNTFIYDDSGRHDVRSQPTDGPGSLNDFAGAQGSGVWMLNMVDNSPTHTGRVEVLTIRLDPMDRRDLGRAGAKGLDGTVDPGAMRCHFIDVPAEATNLIARVSQMTGPLEIYLRRETMATRTNFDKFAALQPPGGEITLHDHEEPAPLLAGRYFVCLFNPGASPVNFHLATELQLGLAADRTITLVSTTDQLLKDDARTETSFDVRLDQQVVDANIGVRIDHPRASDLVLHLISPQGTSVLLAENRGGMNPSGYGKSAGTNFIYTTFTDDTNRFRNLLPIKFAPPPYTNTLFAASQTNAPAMDDGFDEALLGTYKQGDQISGWLVSKGQVEVLDPDTFGGLAPDGGAQFLHLDSTAAPAGVLTNFPTVPGREYLVTFAYHRNPTELSGIPDEVHLYAGPAGDVRAPIKTIEISDLSWQTTSVVFQATSAISAVELSADSSVGPLIDSVEVVEFIPSNLAFVLPEESLGILRGERMAGEWKLQIDDTRAGPGQDTNSLGHLLSWEMQIKFAQARPAAIVLTNSLPFSGTLTNDQTNFFIVDVCPSATDFSALLKGKSDSLVLLASETGFPTGDEQRDTFRSLENTVGGNIGFAALALSTNSPLPAPLRPGRQMYLAVRNKFTDETNHFELQVTLNSPDCGGTRPVIRLLDDIPFTNAVPPTPKLLDYYVFAVSTNAPAVRFELDPQGGDLALFVKRGLPLPNLGNFDYASDLAGTNNEVIIVSTNSSPVPLTPGDWYLAVLNHSTNTVPYTIRATELIEKTVNVIPLTNGAPVDFTITSGSKLTNFFLFQVANSPSQIQFSLSNLTDVADLLIGHDSFPALDKFFQSNSAAPGMPLVVKVTPTALAPTLNGSWYLAVANRSTNDIAFTVSAFATPPPPPSTNQFINPTVELSKTNICFSWPSVPGVTYHLEGRTNLLDPAWTDILGPIVATNAFTERCLPLPTPFRFFQVRPESLVSTNKPAFVNPALLVSSNKITLSWPTTIGSIYHVDAKTNLLDQIWTNISGPLLASSNSLTFVVTRPTSFHFFQIRDEIGVLASGPPAGQTNTVRLLPPKLLVGGRIQLVITNAIVGTTYRLDFATNLIPPIAWATLTNVTATTNTVTVTAIPPNNTRFRFYRVLVP